MLTLKAINENPEEIIRRLSKKHFDGKEIIDQVIALDAIRRDTQTSLDSLLGEINTLSRSIGAFMKEGKKEEATATREKVGTLKESSRDLDETLKDTEEKISQLLVTIPNYHTSRYPRGRLRRITLWSGVGAPCLHFRREPSRIGNLPRSTI